MALIAGFDPDVVTVGLVEQALAVECDAATLKRSRLSAQRAAATKPLFRWRRTSMVGALPVPFPGVDLHARLSIGLVHPAR